MPSRHDETMDACIDTRNAEPNRTPVVRDA